MTRHETHLLTDPAELITTVPYLLGFHPEHSITLVLTKQQNVALTARADLPTDEQQEELREWVTHTLATVDCDTLLAVLTTTHAETATTTCATLVRALVQACEHTHTTLGAVLAENGEQYWDCQEPGPGRPILRDPALLEYLQSGRATVLASREELEQQVAPAHTRVSPDLAERTGQAVADRTLEIRADLARTLMKHLSQTPEQHRELDHAAALGVLMNDVRIRDLLIHDIAHITDHHTACATTDAVTWAAIHQHDDHASNVETAAAICQFLTHGGTVEASTLLQRAIDRDGNSLATLMVRTLHMRLSPTQVRTLLQGITVEEILATTPASPTVTPMAG